MIRSSRQRTGRVEDGDEVSAAWANDVARAAFRKITGPGVIEEDDEIIILGDGGPAKLSDIVRVKVKKDAGSAGTASTACTYTYSIYEKAAPSLSSDFLLATGLTPDTARTATGRYIYAADGTPGLAYQDGDGAWHLYHAADEHPDVIQCAGA